MPAEMRGFSRQKAKYGDNRFPPLVWNRAMAHVVPMGRGWTRIYATGAQPPGLDRESSQMSATTKFAGLNRLLGGAGLFALCAGAMSPGAMAQQAPNARPGTVMVRELPVSQPAKQDPASTVTTDPAAVGGQPVSPAPTGQAAPNGQAAMESSPVVQELPTDYFQAAPTWQVAQAEQLLAYIKNIGNEGLFAADYKPEELQAALASGDPAKLNETATRLFTWLAEDLRDGRTEMDSRRQWFVEDPDWKLTPIKPLLEKALAGRAGANSSGGIVAALDSLNPVHPDYAVLKQMLMETSEGDADARAKIRANMDRWRWLGRNLGRNYLLTNVPEYQLRLVVNNKVHTSFRTIVGKPGRTATPQLAETVEGVIFNPTWTVPQSIVVGEGLGARVLGNPGWARNNGYKGYKNDAGMTIVVQQPGPGNSLGLMKLDMPNPHAIFLHDTPAKALFNSDQRARSHGCVRTEDAMKLAMILAKGLGGLSSEEAVEIANSRKYTRVPLEKELPVYITYFTMARDIDGEMRSFDDIYGRDEPVLASFAAPRQLKHGQHKTSEEVVAIENPGL